MKYIFSLLNILFFYTFTGTLNAKEYTNTSYYVAYDSKDTSQFALVMPSVNKVYTHQAGDVKNLEQIDNQFVTFPTYNKGELCFSALKSGAGGENGASKMANNCYEVNFFYTQKEVTDNGTVFILYYTPSDKVYEGLAGDSKSFEVVKEGNAVYNDNSITGEDYTHFRFNTIDAEVEVGVVDITLNGLLVDGYVRDAKVCIDANFNGECESTEKETTTLIDGNFTLAIDSSYSLMVLVSKGGTDTATDQIMQDELKTVFNLDTTDIHEQIVINAVTDLIAESFLNATIQNSTTLNTIENSFINALGLSKTEMYQDPMKNVKLFIAAQKIKETKKLLHISLSKIVGVERDSFIRNTIAIVFSRALMDEVYPSSEILIENLEKTLNVTLPSNEKTFIIAQLEEVISSLEALESATLTLETASAIQKNLDIEMSVVYTKLETATVSDTLDVVVISKGLDLINGGYVFISTGYGDVPLVMVGKEDNSYISYLSDDNGTTLSGITFTTAENNITTITVDVKGYPLEVITENEIIIFSNYTDTTVGVSVMSKESVLIDYITYELSDQMREYLKRISGTQLQLALLKRFNTLTAQEQFEFATKAGDKAVDILGIVKDVGEHLEKTGKFTRSDALKYISKKLLGDYLKDKLKENSVAYETYDNLVDMLSESAGCVGGDPSGCTVLVYKTLKHTTELYTIYQDIKDIKESSDTWTKETEALLAIKKAEYLAQLLLELEELKRHELERDKDWWIECGDFSQKEVNGVCVAKTCKTDGYGCPSCNTLEELKFDENETAYCALKACGDDEKREELFCVAKTCYDDEYDCPVCTDSEKLSYYEDGSAYCGDSPTCTADEKLVNGQCVDIDCTGDTFECTGCKVDEIFVATDENGTAGYCEKSTIDEHETSEFKVSDISHVTSTYETVCANGWVKETIDEDIECRLYDVDGILSKKVVIKEQIHSSLINYYEMYKGEHNIWYKVLIKAVNYYENGTIQYIADYKIYQDLNNLSRSAIIEKHSWNKDGLRSSSIFYKTCKTNTGFATSSRLLDESFSSLGKIVQRYVYIPYKDNAGICKYATSISEDFDDNKNYTKKEISKYLKDDNGVLREDMHIIKKWDTYEYSISIEEDRYESGKEYFGHPNRFRSIYKGYYDNKLLSESSFFILKNNDESYISLLNKSTTYHNDQIWYYEYTHKLNTEGIWYNDSYIFDDYTPEGVHILRDNCTYATSAFICERIYY